LLRHQLLEPTEQKAKWVPEAVCILWRKEKFLVPSRHRNTIPSLSFPQHSQNIDFTTLVLWRRNEEIRLSYKWGHWMVQLLKEPVTALDRKSGDKRSIQEM
jgi:hypothetical protein